MILWNSEGVLKIGYSEQGKPATCVYHGELIKKRRAAVKEKCRETWHQSVLLHRDKAPAQTSTNAMASVCQCGFKLLY